MKLIHDRFHFNINSMVNGVMKILFTKNFNDIFRDETKQDNITIGINRCKIINEVKDSIKKQIEAKYECNLDNIKNGWSIRELNIVVSGKDIMDSYKAALQKIDEEISSGEKLKTEILDFDFFFKIKE